MMSRTTASSPDCLAAESTGPLHALLDWRAANFPDEVPFRFLPDGENPGKDRTYREISHRARAIAASLMDRGLAGKPVLLIEPAGPDFIEGLFGCWHAGAIAVPAYPPRGTRHRQRLAAVMADSGARFALGPCQEGVANDLEVLPTRILAENHPFPGEARTTEGPCLLQYTSGSTAAPKGVMISHSNLRAHHASLQGHKSAPFASMLSWLPPYHDMGLVLKILNAFEDGVPLVWFSADHFIQRPIRWLRAISRFRAEFSGAPDFAYDACTRLIRDEDLQGLDLSCWKAAPCGAERVRASTLRAFAERFRPYGFDEHVFYPGYGMAETTLIVTARPQGAELPVTLHGKAGELVSCGTPVRGVRVHITDPDTGARVEDECIGEIRIEGPMVSQGYWKRPEESAATFPGHGGIHTGDLGFLKDGHLYVTGRQKDLIIIDGVNHSPEDIEEAARQANGDIRAAAAVAIESGASESLTLILEGAWSNDSPFVEIRRDVRCAVASRCGVPVHEIHFTRSGLLPRTTSGKIRRFACREALADGTLKWINGSKLTDSTDDRSPHLDLVLTAIREIGGPAGARATDNLAGLGMGSIDAARIAGWIEEQSGARLPIGIILAAESFAALAGEIPAFSSPEPRFSGTILERGRLTHSQQRMWFLHQLDPNGTAYHVFGVIELNGPLDREALKASFDHVIGLHSMLRSRHGLKDGSVRAWIDDGDVPKLGFNSLADESSARTHLQAFASIPFDLENAPPIRAELVALDKERHLLAVCAHHIAADGWSMRILATQLGAAYSAMVSGEKVTLAANGGDFLDYAARHRAWAEGRALDDQLEYWKSRLAGHPGSIRLPLDFPRPARPDDRGELVTCDLPAELCNSLASIAHARGATPFMVHLAAFLLLLRQHGAGNDLITAVPVANRHLPGSGDLVGTLVNTLPFRLNLTEKSDFPTLLDTLRDAVVAMLENQDIPFERILAEAGVGRVENEAPLAQVMFDHQEIPIRETWTGGINCQPFTCHRGASQFDLSMLLNVFPDRQQLCIEYRSALFSRSAMEAMLHRHIRILTSICDQPERSLAEIGSLSASDLEQLDAWSVGPIRPDFPQRLAPIAIASRVKAHPDRLATRDLSSSLTYQELDALSSGIAAALRAKGVSAGDPVAMMIERDRRLPAALLGIWKCGAVVVPLDPSNPPARLAHILAEQHPTCGLVSAAHLTTLAAVSHKVLLDEVSADAEFGEIHPLSPSDAAYVLHTSGSTGRPKGVAIPHGALGNFLQSMAETPGFTEADHLLAVTTVSFDIAMLELLLPLITGGSLSIVSTETAADGTRLLDAIHTQRPTVMQATPATWRLLLDAGWKGTSDLKILCGGEALELSLARVLVGHGCQLWNLYGPTETTVWSTCWRVPQDVRAIRIGSPIANTGIHLLSEDGQSVPPGVQGELWISGAGLAMGYCHLPELTAERFTLIRDARGRETLAYRTGDLARWHRDGTLECLGRSDGQIKIRGFRVELGEIDSTLADHPSVAIARSTLRGKSAASKRLVSWVTARKDGEPPDPAALKSYLAERLPSHMIPADIAVIPAFPLGTSGKIDLAQLPTPESVPVAQAAATETERILITIWQDLLDRPQVSPLDNWFHIGGHSLLALRLFARIHKEFGIRAPLSAILENPNPRSLAELIDRSEPSN